MANAAEATPTATMTTNTTPTGGQNRRIVKAAHPKPVANGVTENNINSNDAAAKVDNDDEDNNKHHHHHHEQSLAEDVQETAEEWRKERLSASNNRSKALRDKQVQERRKNPQNNKSSDATPNPFSRFLSAFSVEPKFPEHKRSLEETPEDEDLKGPSEKRLKAADPDAPETWNSDDGDDSNDPSGGGILSSRFLWATAVAVVAVGVAVALQRSRRK